MATLDDAADAANNSDPITGAPGAHPVGTGIGAVVGGALAGAATGTVAGPVGTLVGAAIGAVAGGLAGKGVAEAIDPTLELAYWRDNFVSRPYVEPGASFVDYGPAYSYGVDTALRFKERDFADVEPELSANWERSKGTSQLPWDRARNATQDAWYRAQHSEISESLL